MTTVRLITIEIGFTPRPAPSPQALAERRELMRCVVLAWAIGFTLTVIACL